MRIDVEEVYPIHPLQHLDAGIEASVILLHHPGSEEGEVLLLHLLDSDHRLQTEQPGQRHLGPHGERTRGRRKSARMAR
jgi:hypothetical protein